MIYWLKGGILGLFSLLVLYLIVMVEVAKYGCTGLDDPTISCSTTDIVNYYFTSIITLPFQHIVFFILFICAIAIAFGIGALISWIYLKIRKRTK